MALISMSDMTEMAIHTVLEQRRQFLAFVQRRVGDAAAAEDILQGAYMRALRQEDDFETQQSVVAWFYRVLRNAVIDHYRRRGSEDKALEAFGREMQDAAHPSHEIQAEICGCLRGVVDTLKPDYAEVIRAVDLGEQPLTEFAQGHGLSASNAGVRAHRARAALKKQLTETCGSCATHGCLDCRCKK